MPDRDTPLRRLLLAVVILGATGLAAELVFLEHWEEARQWIPFVALTLTVVASGALWLRPSRRTVRVFRGTMGAVTVAGLLGVWFHWGSNLAFERELDPDGSGVSFVWEVLRGATPLLAPGALVQLGLLGLILTYRHPLLQQPSSTSPGTGDPDTEIP